MHDIRSWLVNHIFSTKSSSLSILHFRSKSPSAMCILPTPKQISTTLFSLLDSLVFSYWRNSDNLSCLRLVDIFLQNTCFISFSRILWSNCAQSPRNGFYRETQYTGVARNLRNTFEKILVKMKEEFWGFEGKFCLR